MKKHAVDVIFRDDLPHELLGSASDVLRLQRALACNSSSNKDDCCLCWMGPQRIRWAGRRFVPRTLLYALCNDRVPPDDVVEARCSNARDCINPKHLVLRPRLANISSMRTKLETERVARDALAKAYEALARFDAAEALMPSLKRPRLADSLVDRAPRGREHGDDERLEF